MEKGRVVLITGAAGGMGALFARRFPAHGDTVIATDTSGEALAKLANGVADGATLFTLAADISDEASCAKLAAFALAKAAHVDVLVNCAGFFRRQPFMEMSLADWNKVIGINLTGVFLMVKAILPLMTGRGWCRIINIGSASIRGRRYTGPLRRRQGRSPRLLKEPGARGRGGRHHCRSRRAGAHADARRPRAYARGNDRGADQVARHSAR